MENKILEIKQIKKNKGQLLMKVYNCDEHFYECNYAIAIIDEPLKKIIIKGIASCREAHKKFNPLFFCIKLWSPATVYYLPDELFGEESDLMNDGEFQWSFIEPIEGLNELECTRTETDQLKIQRDGFSFISYVKHTSIELYTDSFQLSIFKK